jgi:trimeric autotransporter adhesin
MAVASITSATSLANQMSALSAQSIAQAHALSASAGNPAGASPVGGGSLFADLVSALSQGAITINSPAAATAASPASTIGSPGAAGSSASRGQITQDLQAFTRSLLQALNANQSAPLQGGSSITAGSAGAGVSSASASTSMANLNTTFNQLMTDISAGANPGSAGMAANPAAGVAPSGVSTPNARSVLPRLMQGMLQHLQQQGSMAASVGRAVHVVA